jgi:nicotinamidase-related amidase
LISGKPAMTRRVDHDRCLGVLIDVQEFFLSQVDKRLQSRLKKNITYFVRLLGYFRVPTLVTLERPVERKGTLPADIRVHLGDQVETFHKDFFDLTKDKKIGEYVGRSNKKQIIIAGCETDVCVLQSCLGLLHLGYEAYVVEDLLFSSSRNVEVAIARMQAEGAIFLTYKSLYYELVEAVDGGAHAKRMIARFGPLPEDLPDCAAE